MRFIYRTYINIRSSEGDEPLVHILQYILVCVLQHSCRRSQPYRLDFGSISTECHANIIIFSFIFIFIWYVVVS